MAEMRLTGHARRAMKAVVFEPRQTPEQEEVILEEHILRAGEEKPIEVRSATAGYRLVDLTGDERDKLDKDGDGEPDDAPTPDQEGTVTAAAQAEIDAGKKRLSEHESDAKRSRTSTASKSSKSSKK